MPKVKRAWQRRENCLCGNATAARKFAAVFDQPIGHGEAVDVEFENAVTAGEARAALREAPGVEVVDVREDGGYVTPIECAGEDAVYVSRIRKDPTVQHGLSFWCVSDNLRKGAALNAVQIAEELIARGMLAKQAA